MNKKKISIILIFFIAILSTFVFVKNNSNVEITNEVNNKSKKNNDLLTMNLEQTAGAGDYKTVTQSEWPTEGYKFNTELSRCENGSELSWDDVNKKILMSGVSADKCYVYFDIARFDKLCNTSTLACHVAKLYTGTQGENGIYYHNTSLTNGAGDNNYRYAGANPNNYICLGSDATTCPDDNLFRIIGVFGDKVKVIKDKSVVKMHWDTSNYNTWSISSLNTYLNGTYLTSMGTLSDKIDVATWKVGGNTWDNISVSTAKEVYDYEIKNPSTTASTGETEYSAKIGLMYVSDYMFAVLQDNWTLVAYNSNDATKDYRAIKAENWLYLGSDEYTITRSSKNSGEVFAIYSSGEVYSYSVSCDSGEPLPCSVYAKYARPSFYLISSVEYSGGTGTSSDPIRIN
ncbi:MAG: hypothetical protein KIC90_03955 [Firmicutes bacterium]|jgi:hypothetical protein|nr:hypothetical protein [Bacillota bacterium]